MRGWILEMEPLSLISVFWLFVGAVIFLLFLPCRAAASMRGRRLYLSPNGRDTNPGSLDAPWATLDKASREACPGDAIILLPGTYNDVFAPVRGGTAEAPILLQAAKIGTAKLVPPDGAAALLLENVSHIWIRGVHVSPASTGVWARITDASHIRIEDSLFENSRSGTPFVIRRCSQIRIVGNEFRQWSRDWKTTDPAGINMVVVYDSSHLLFEGNAFGAALHTGLQFRPEGRNDHVVARGNVFHSGWSRSYEFFGTDVVLFEGNVVTNGFHGARSADAHNKFSVERGIYRFNRVFRNWGGPERFMSRYIGAAKQKLHDVRVYHNVFDDNVGFGLMIDSLKGKQGQRIFQNNIISRNDSYGAHLQVHGRPDTEEHLLRRDLRFIRNAVWADNDHEALRGRYALFEETLFVRPDFFDSERYDHLLTPDSPLVDAGRPLTFAVGSGKGTIVHVEDAAFFYDGFGIEGEVGDLIAVGRSNQKARVVKADWTNNRLHLDREVSWKDGDPVSFPWSGAGPDLGPYEQGEGGRTAVRIKMSAFELSPGDEVTLQADLLGSGTVADARWYLGNGRFASGPCVQVTYETPGDYPIRVRVTDQQGAEHWGTAYLVVREREPEIERPLLEFTFDADDTEWWKFWKAYRPLPAQWRRVLDPETGAGYISVTAPEGGENGIMPLWIYPVGWNLGAHLWWGIDAFPYVVLRYRLQPGTPIGLYVEALGGPAGKRVQLAGAQAHDDRQTPRAGSAGLVDDGAWHELVVDVRAIRDVYREVRYLQGIGLQTAETSPSSVGAYDVDDFRIVRRI